MSTEQSRARRAFTADPDLSGLDRSTRTLVGLELMMMHTKPRVKHTREDIAAWAGCTNEAIRRIEVSALRRLRKLRAKIQTELRLSIQ